MGKKGQSFLFSVLSRPVARTTIEQQQKSLDREGKERERAGSSTLGGKQREEREERARKARGKTENFNASCEPNEVNQYSKIFIFRCIMTKMPRNFSTQKEHVGICKRG
jgi:hypothetical protein